jgi:hypothetical protein
MSDNSTFSFSDIYFPRNINPSVSNNKCTANGFNCIVCTEKCQLSYVDSILSGTCKTYDWGLLYDNIQTASLNPSPIKFNEDEYFITQICILIPAVGTYSDNKFNTGCEIIFKTHSNNDYLNIILPIAVTDDYQNITTPSNIPDADSNKTVSISGINLSDYIPTQPFVFYSDNSKNFIVFPTSNLSISKSNKTYICNKMNNNTSTENSTCDESKIKDPNIHTGTIYYNTLGPGDIADSDEIYIDCRPTDHSEDNVYVQDSEGSTQSKTNVLNNKFMFHVIVGVVIILFVYIVVRILLWFFSPDVKLVKKSI